MKEASNDQKILKEYLANLRMDQARTKFKIKTKMLKNVKMNYKNDPKGTTDKALPASTAKERED